MFTRKKLLTTAVKLFWAICNFKKALFAMIRTNMPDSSVCAGIVISGFYSCHSSFTRSIFAVSFFCLHYVYLLYNMQLSVFSFAL